MIKVVLLLLVLLLDYVGYRYAKSRLSTQKDALTRRKEALKKTLAQKRARLEAKTKELEKELKEEEDELDDFIDKETFNFLLLGLVATFLFLLIGLFTGNGLYFYLLIFLITTLVYVYYSKMQ